MKRALLVVTLALALAACAKQRVLTQPDQPPLAPPPPPPRVVAPPDTEEPPPPPPPEPERRPVRHAPPKGEPAPPRVEPPKTPAKPETPPAPQETTPPPTTLQTAKPGAQAEMEKQVRGTLAQATRDLGRVNYGGLNADGKGQYDTAKRFVEQAQQAIKEQNLMLASRLADKAATIASVLVSR